MISSWHWLIPVSLSASVDNHDCFPWLPSGAAGGSPCHNHSDNPPRTYVTTYHMPYIQCITYGLVCRFRASHNLLALCRHAGAVLVTRMAAVVSTSFRICNIITFLKATTDHDAVHHIPRVTQMSALPSAMPAVYHAQHVFTILLGGDQSWPRPPYPLSNMGDGADLYQAATCSAWIWLIPFPVIFTRGCRS